MNLNEKPQLHLDFLSQFLTPINIGTRFVLYTDMKNLLMHIYIIEHLLVVFLKFYINAGQLELPYSRYISEVLETTLPCMRKKTIVCSCVMKREHVYKVSVLTSEFLFSL